MRSLRIQIKNHLMSGVIFYAVNAVLGTRGKVGHDAFNWKHLKKEIY